MESLHAEENACFEEWRSVRPRLVPDGAVDPAEYAKSSPKLLFVLKEVNDIRDERWDLREFLRKGGRAQTWNNVTRWTKALTPGGGDLPWAAVEHVDEEVRKAHLRSIAAINVKKTSGGGSSSWQEIHEFAQADAHFLETQFSLYEPDFTVFCGLSPSLVPQFACASVNYTKRGIEYREFTPGRFGIAFWHPQARYPAQLMYYALADAADELRTQVGGRANGS